MASVDLLHAGYASPEVDPYADDQAVLKASRDRVLAAADVVIPGRGGPFRVKGVTG